MGLLQLPVDQLLDVAVHDVDGQLTLTQRERELPVAVQQGLGRRGQTFGDQREQLDHPAFDGLHLAVVLETELVGHAPMLSSGGRGARRGTSWPGGAWPQTARDRRRGQAR